MKITRVITGPAAVIALLSISILAACSIFPKKKIIYTSDKPEGFYQVKVTETEGWYNWFCAEKNTVTFQARVINKDEVDLYYERERHSWFERSGKDEIKWHHTVGVGSFFGVPWRYEKRIDTLTRDHPFFEMFDATTKHWESKQRPLWVSLFRTGGVLTAVVIVAVLAVVGVSVYLSKRRKRMAAPAAAVPTTPTPARAPSYEPPPPKEDIPPPERDRPKRGLKPARRVILIIIANVLVVAVLVAAFFVTDYLGVNPLTAPPAEEEPAAPPAEVEARPAVPGAEVKFAVLHVLGGDRTAAGVGQDMVGKAESISRLIGDRGAGEVELDLSVSSGGGVVRAKVVRSTYKDATLESKIASAARGWKFSPAAGTSRVRVKATAE